MGIFEDIFGRLIYKDAVSPGCRLGRYLAPLVLCCMWTGYAVVAAAMRVAENTQRNVRLLPKLADYLPEGADSRIREGILEILKQHSEGKGRRWGVSLCKYHIDLTFWKVASTYLRTMAFALVAVLPAILLLARQQRMLRREEEQKAQQERLSHAHEAAKRAAQEKERQLKIARDEAMSQQQRAEASERAALAEQDE